MHHFRFRRVLTRACLALLFGLLASTPVLAANPALWRAQDNDTTVYFFGTVHVMKQGTQWHYPTLDKALAASNVLYIEATDANQATVKPLVLQYGLDPAHPLSSMISKQENTLLQQAATQMDIPAAALEMMRPWLAGISISAAPILKAGYDPKLGVDKMLQAQFKKAGKPVKGLESAKEQILMLANLPQSLQLALLRQSLHQYKHARTLLSATINAWEKGDVARLAKVVDLQMKSGSPKLYQILVVQRNEGWAKQIATLMKTTPGTIFVAVGSGHLVGPDRVQAQLQKLGIHVNRVNP